VIDSMRFINLWDCEKKKKSTRRNKVVYHCPNWTSRTDPF